MSLPDFNLEIDVAHLPFTDLVVSLPTEHSLDTLAGHALRTVANLVISHASMREMLRLLVHRDGLGFLFDSAVSGFTALSDADMILRASRPSAVDARPASTVQLTIEIAGISDPPRRAPQAMFPTLRWLVCATAPDTVPPRLPDTGNVVIDRSGDHRQLSRVCESFLMKVVDGASPDVNTWMADTVNEFHPPEPLIVPAGESAGHDADGTAPSSTEVASTQVTPVQVTPTGPGMHSDSVDLPRRGGVLSRLRRRQGPKGGRVS